jgi:hypothetical protein
VFEHTYLSCLCAGCSAGLCWLAVVAALDGVAGVTAVCPACVRGCVQESVLGPGEMSGVGVLLLQREVPEAANLAAAQAAHDAGIPVMLVSTGALGCGGGGVGGGCGRGQGGGSWQMEER